MEIIKSRLERKKSELWSHMARVQIPATVFLNCVALGKGCGLLTSVLRLVFPQGFVRIQVGCWSRRSVHGECPVNIREQPVRVKCTRKECARAWERAEKSRPQAVVLSVWNHGSWCIFFSQPGTHPEGGSVLPYSQILAHPWDLAAQPGAGPSRAEAWLVHHFWG